MLIQNGHCELLAVEQGSLSLPTYLFLESRTKWIPAGLATMPLVLTLEAIIPELVN